MLTIKFLSVILFLPFLFSSFQLSLFIMSSNTNYDFVPTDPSSEVEEATQVAARMCLERLRSDIEIDRVASSWLIAE